jgi:nitroimidazol reductase NimA-like FMN-containing flavoprotein (pyridoxamine 5'-phosphate oxidase superfamily)
MPELMSTDRAELDALLASTVVGHVGFVDDTGRARVLPTAVVRWGERIVIHGSTGSGWLRRLAEGAPACVTVTAVDGVVVARSAFESSLLYRSAVLFGQFTVLQGTEKLAALDALTDRLLPGRVAEVRRPTAKELAATLLLAMPLTEWSLRTSDGFAEDPDDDVAGPAWAGQVRLGPAPLSIVPAPGLRPGIPVPASVAAVAGLR